MGDKNPGPGNYDIKGDLESPKNNGLKFSKSRRGNTESQNAPGPGSYEYEDAIFKYGSKQDPSYGMGVRR